MSSTKKARSQSSRKLTIMRHPSNEECVTRFYGTLGQDGIPDRRTVQPSPECRELARTVDVMPGA